MIEQAKNTPIHVVIIGASGHARVIADMVRCAGDIVDGFLDDREADRFPGLRLLGRVDDAMTIAQESSAIRFIIGIGNNEAREKIANKLGSLNFHTAIHPSAVVASDVSIGVGTALMANTVVNTGSVIGAHSIINTGATVDHDCVIADFVHLSPGVHLSGTVGVGRASWLGTGVSVSNNVNICGGCTVGAGAVVVRDIDTAGTYMGVPARRGL